MQYFVLKSPEIRSNAINFINALNINGAPFAVEIKPYKKNRSNAQNRLYWSWVNLIAKECGYDPDDLHEEFRVRFLGVEERYVKGQKLIIPKSTTKLTTKEFTDYLTKIELVAGELGISLPHPSDYSYIMGKQ